MLDSVTLEPMIRCAENSEYAYEVKRDALGPYVIEKWGWDDAVQRKIHSERWTTKTFFRILVDGESVGVVSVDDFPEHRQLGEFYILSAFRNRGFGTAVLQRLMQEADAKGLRVRLEFLKWNPVGVLYKRHGFDETDENEIHYFMERSVGGHAS